MQVKTCKKCQQTKPLEKNFSIEHGFARNTCNKCLKRSNTKEFKDMDFVVGIFIGEFRGLQHLIK